MKNQYCCVIEGANWSHVELHTLIYIYKRVHTRLRDAVRKETKLSAFTVCEICDICKENKIRKIILPLRNEA